MYAEAKNELRRLGFRRCGAIYVAHTITDDGSMPDGEEGAVLAEQGARGVIVMKGHVEQNPSLTVFLVRFENQALNLGRPIGCWTEDLFLPEASVTH